MATDPDGQISSIGHSIAGQNVIHHSPVFIITCVVARLTFFLNPIQFY
jgi:hypothetical protein